MRRRIACTLALAGLALAATPAASAAETWQQTSRQTYYLLDALQRSQGIATDGTLALGELADRAWVHYSPGNGLADLVDRAWAEAGLRPRIAVRAEQTSAALLLAAGLGPALVPANIIPPDFDGAALRPDPPIQRTLTAYTRTRPDRLTTAFTDLLARQAQVVPPHFPAGRPPAGPTAAP